MKETSILSIFNKQVNARRKFVRKRVFSFTVYWGPAEYTETLYNRRTRSGSSVAHQRQFLSEISSVPGFVGRFWFAYQYCRKHGVKFEYEKKEVLI